MKSLLLTAALAASVTVLRAQGSLQLDDPNIQAEAPRKLPFTGLIAHPDEHAWLGVTVMETKDGEGLTVDVVAEKSPASRAGIQKGDVLLKFDETVLDSLQTLRAQVAAAEVPSQVTLEILRDGKPQMIKATLSARPPLHFEQQRRLDDAMRELHERGINPPDGLFKEPFKLKPHGPLEVELDPFKQNPRPKLKVDDPEALPQLKVESEWGKDGQLKLRWIPDENPSAEKKPGAQRERQTEDLIWRKVQAAVAESLEKSGAAPEVREAAAKAIQKARIDWNSRELRRRKMIEEAKQLETEIQKLKERSERLYREAKELE